MNTENQSSVLSRQSLARTVAGHLSSAIAPPTARKIAWGRPPPAVQAERQLGRNSVVFNLHKSLRSEIQKVANRKVAQGQPPVSADDGRLKTDDCLISASPPPAHLPETQPAPAVRLRATPPRSCHSIPTRAACAAPDSRQSPLCVRPASPAHKPPRSPPRSVALRCRYRLPAAAVCRRFSPSPRP